MPVSEMKIAGPQKKMFSDVARGLTLRQSLTKPLKALHFKTKAAWQHTQKSHRGVKKREKRVFNTPYCF